MQVDDNTTQVAIDALDASLAHPWSAVTVTEDRAWLATEQMNLALDTFADVAHNNQNLLALQAALTAEHAAASAYLATLTTLTLPASTASAASGVEAKVTIIKQDDQAVLVMNTEADASRTITAAAAFVVPKYTADRNQFLSAILAAEPKS